MSIASIHHTNCRLLHCVTFAQQQQQKGSGEIPPIQRSAAYTGGRDIGPGLAVVSGAAGGARGRGRGRDLDAGGASAGAGASGSGSRRAASSTILVDQVGPPSDSSGTGQSELDDVETFEDDHSRDGRSSNFTDSGMVLSY